MCAMAIEDLNAAMHTCTHGYSTCLYYPPVYDGQTDVTLSTPRGTTCVLLPTVYLQQLYRLYTGSTQPCWWMTVIHTPMMVDDGDPHTHGQLSYRQRSSPPSIVCCHGYGNSDCLLSLSFLRKCCNTVLLVIPLFSTPTLNAADPTQSGH